MHHLSRLILLRIEILKIELKAVAEVVYAQVEELEVILR